MKRSLRRTKIESQTTKKKNTNINKKGNKERKEEKNILKEREIER